MAKRTVAVAPPRLGGDAVEVAPLEGKLIAILCVSRDEKKTKYGMRKMTHVAIVDEADAKMAVLEGIMFQSYFQELELDQWYIGKVARVDAGGNRAWVLETTGLEAPKVKAFAKRLEAVKLRSETAAEIL